MAKKEDVKQEAPVFDENRPVLDTPASFASEEVISHQWQKGSPALDLRGQEFNGTNIIADLEKKEEDKPKKKEKISEAEKERRGKLDVSHADYLNPSLDY